MGVSHGLHGCVTWFTWVYHMHHICVSHESCVCVGVCMSHSSYIVHLRMTACIPYLLQHFIGEWAAQHAGRFSG